MTIKYIQKDLFKTSAPAILAHACNTHGIWGGGIALQFSKKFPSTERKYINHCQSHTPSELLGTTLLIKSELNDPGNLAGKQPHVIACLFTSKGGGGDADSPQKIVENTERAIKDLENQLNDTMEDWLLDTKPTEGNWLIELPKINAGIFRVPWDETEKVLKGSEKLDFTVYVV
ncbi:ADP-ribose 1''-phosphate phosphatase [Wickerhamomyces ciferrii]|uniref:ADP-ribose 1''-phosphate phosphatase n=1 Tax=Wickerhamomyces ciferrii (strain ATCC 14091 / BCRC 22168 / CBS 111 / JCM 3599 / NBRC 0793 / NRRL Y-1031 F-60-10) TaxID=1206466 RepID=K0KS90_WICCF|nr:ADP-ribose 1''-phosphate phosphatase [Wickerhamomyces ciferrii]CCH44867.1 ADP-ribose 1''-phosphate phosphatase [Wickerhamomyces ciferrii]